MTVYLLQLLLMMIMGRLHNVKQKFAKVEIVKLFAGAVEDVSTH